MCSASRAAGYKVVEAGTWAEETAAESGVVEELQPAQGESAGASPRALRTAAASGAGARLLMGLWSRYRPTILVVVMGEP